MWEQCVRQTVALFYIWDSSSNAMETVECVYVYARKSKWGIFQEGYMWATCKNVFTKYVYTQIYIASDFALSHNTLLMFKHKREKRCTSYCTYYVRNFLPNDLIYTRVDLILLLSRILHFSESEKFPTFFSSSFIKLQESSVKFFHLSLSFTSNLFIYLNQTMGEVVDDVRFLQLPMLTCTLACTFWRLRVKVIFYHLPNDYHCSPTVLHSICWCEESKFLYCVGGTSQ